MAATKAPTVVECCSLYEKLVHPTSSRVFSITNTNAAEAAYTFGTGTADAPVPRVESGQYGIVPAGSTLAAMLEVAPFWTLVTKVRVSPVRRGALVSRHAKRQVCLRQFVPTYGEYISCICALR